MPAQYVTQLIHYLDEAGGFPLEIPNEARSMGAFLGSIVAWTTKLIQPGFADLTNCPCIGELHGKLCCSPLMGSLSEDSTTIWWHCPACGTAGIITNWEHTKYDRRGDE